MYSYILRGIRIYINVGYFYRFSSHIPRTNITFNACIRVLSNYCYFFNIPMTRKNFQFCKILAFSQYEVIFYTKLIITKIYILRECKQTVTSLLLHSVKMTQKSCDTNMSVHYISNKQCHNIKPKYSVKHRVKPAIRIFGLHEVYSSSRTQDYFLHKGRRK